MDCNTRAVQGQPIQTGAITLCCKHQQAIALARVLHIARAPLQTTIHSRNRACLLLTTRIHYRERCRMTGCDFAKGRIGRRTCRRQHRRRLQGR